MSGLSELLAELERAGVQVERRGDRLRVRAAARPGDELLDRLKAMRQELLSALPDAEATRVVLHFRLKGEPPGAWCSMIATGSAAEAEAELRERFGDRLAEVRKGQRRCRGP